MKRKCNRVKNKTIEIRIKTENYVEKNIEMLIDYPGKQYGCGQNWKKGIELSNKTLNIK